MLAPPIASASAKPAVQASNQVINTINTILAPPSSSSTSDDGKSPDKATTKPADKSDTKELASADKSGTKNEPVKKMYCN